MPSMLRTTTHLARRFTSTSSVIGSIQELPLQPPSPSVETAQFQERVNQVQAFFDLPRFASVKRPYTAASVVAKQGSHSPLPLPSALTATKLYAQLEDASKEGKPLHTMGAIDPVQMTQMAKYQEVLYVSGWACSSVLTTGNNEVGPDFG